MIISHANRWILFHNPKAAGTTFRCALAAWHDDPVTFRGYWRPAASAAPVDLTHLRLDQVQVLCPRILQAAESYRSAVILRNPFDRFLSAINQYFRATAKDIVLGLQSPDMQTRMIEAFIDTVLTDARAILDYRLIHFTPQMSFVRLGELQVPRHIVPMDHEGAFIPDVLDYLGLEPFMIGHENASTVDLAHVLGSSRINNFVRRFYAEDFAFLADNPSCAHLANGSLQHAD